MLALIMQRLGMDCHRGRPGPLERQQIVTLSRKPGTSQGTERVRHTPGIGLHCDFQRKEVVRKGKEAQDLLTAIIPESSIIQIIPRFWH